MNGIAKNLKALSLDTIGQMPSMTKGQKALLLAIRKCVESGKPLDFESILLVYYHNVRKTFKIGEGWYTPTDDNGNPRYGYGRYTEWVEYDILKCWQNQEKLWYFKASIRQWFVSNIGILVVKNQLVIVPTINLDE